MIIPHTESIDTLPPMAIGGLTANLFSEERFAVSLPTAVGSKSPV
jgi:hypothetical protein